MGYKMNKYEFFWNTMELCDWTKEGDDNKVIMPVVKYLSSQDDETIFRFDDLMSELLYYLDTKKLIEQCEKTALYASDDTFLYSRCVALINGPEYYEKAKNGKKKEIWDMEFEALLYIPQRAWALKHKKQEEEYPHFAPLSYETGSNTEGWK